MKLSGTRGVHWVAPGRLDQLPARIESTGWCREQANYSWFGQQRGSLPLAILQYTLDGAGEVRRQGRTWQLVRGDLMLVYTPDDHWYGLPAGGGCWEFLYCCITGEAALRLARETVQATGPVVQLPPEHPGIQTLREVHHECTRSTDWDPLRNSATAWTLLTGICRAMHDRSVSETDRELLHLADWISVNLHQPLGVADLAERVGQSRYHFTRRFVRYFGLPPGKYLEQRRIRKAGELLLSESTPVAVIAGRCGYPDPNYFSRVFRKVIGESPGAFRRRLGAGSLNSH